MALHLLLLRPDPMGKQLENNWKITALKLVWSLVLVHISGPKLPICVLLQAEAVPVGNKQIADHGRAVFWGLERMPGLL